MFPITGQKTILNLGFSTLCYIAVDPSETDLGMVPTGTKCGANKVRFICIFLVNVRYESVQNQGEFLSGHTYEAFHVKCKKYFFFLTGVLQPHLPGR